MANINFNELNLENNIDIKPIQKKGLTIEIKQYLPIEEKTKVIENIVNKSLDDNNFANPARIELNFVLEMVYAYTNLTFTENEKENFLNLYDIIVSSGLWEEIINNIPTSEYNLIKDTINQTIQEVYRYKTSALGIMQAITEDYSNLDLDAEKIREKLGNKENIELLTEVMDKMG